MMTFESNGTVIVDEIDRLFVVYEKAKEYLSKISSGIDQQVDLWQHRRQIILDQIKSTSSFDFLLPKTQRINELTIEAVQGLCRVDLLVEQILRIDPKSLAQLRSMPTSSSFSARSIDTTISNSTTNTVLSRARHVEPSPSLNSIKQQSYVEPALNGKIIGQPALPIPVLRTTQLTSTNRSATVGTHEKVGFKPIEQQQQQQSSIIADNTSRPTPIHPQNNHYAAAEGLNFPRSIAPSYGTRTPPSDDFTGHMTQPPTSQILPNRQRIPRGKVTVKLQRIPPGTCWKQAQIEVIDSLSAFYVLNYDDKVHSRFSRMLDDLHDYYNGLERKGDLIPLQDISIGDFGVAKYSVDDRWYRARLLMREGHDRIRIVYIDFGNIESKFTDEFFALDQLYTDLPAQAIACSLSQAYPRTPNEDDSFWPKDTIEIFRTAVTETLVEVSFADIEDGTEKWPLHFVTITVGNKSVANLLNLKQRIEPKPNCFIVEQLLPALKQQEYILFNVPFDEDSLQ